jgi:hypothetical protein
MQSLIPPHGKILKIKNTFEKWYPWIITSMKRTRQQDLQATWMKTNLALNPSHGIKKSKVKTKTWCVHNVNAKGFYYKKVTKIWQDHDKHTYPKLVLNKLKVMGNFIFI